MSVMSHVQRERESWTLSGVLQPISHTFFMIKFALNFVISAAYASPHSPGERFAGVLSGPLFLRAEEKFFGLSGGLYFPVLFS